MGLMWTKKFYTSTGFFSPNQYEPMKKNNLFKLYLTVYKLLKFNVYSLNCCLPKKTIYII